MYARIFIDLLSVYCSVSLISRASLVYFLYVALHVRSLGTIWSRSLFCFEIKTHEEFRRYATTCTRAELIGPGAMPIFRSDPCYEACFRNIS